MDATEYGLQFFYTILLPGFMFGVGFRFTSGFQGKGSDFSHICSAAFFGVILFSIINSYPEQLARIIANPIGGGTALAMSAIVLGAIIGIPFGWIRRKIR